MGVDGGMDMEWKCVVDRVTVACACEVGWELRSGVWDRVEETEMG